MPPSPSFLCHVFLLPNTLLLRVQSFSILKL